MSVTPFDPFVRGQTACKNGAPRDAVPFPVESLAYEHWLEGWDDWYYHINPSEKPADA